MDIGGAHRGVDELNFQVQQSRQGRCTLSSPRNEADVVLLWLTALGLRATVQILACICGPTETQLITVSELIGQLA